MADWIFLDNHTKTRPKEFLIEQMARSAKEHWLIAPSEKAKQQIATHLGAEGYYMAIDTDAHFSLLFSHYLDYIRKTGRTHILAAEKEQTSILSAIETLERFEVQGKILPVNDKGHLTAKSLQEAIRARSSILSLSWAHPYTGVVQPLHDLAACCRENDVRLHVDISAAMGKLYF